MEIFIEKYRYRDGSRIFFVSHWISLEAPPLSLLYTGLAFLKLDVVTVL